MNPAATLPRPILELTNPVGAKGIICGKQIYTNPQYQWQLEITYN